VGTTTRKIDKCNLVTFAVNARHLVMKLVLDGVRVARLNLSFGVLGGNDIGELNESAYYFVRYISNIAIN
jgi:hypothetical protein